MMKLLYWKRVGYSNDYASVIYHSRANKMRRCCGPQSKDGKKTTWVTVGHSRSEVTLTVKGIFLASKADLGQALAHCFRLGGVREL